jgi:hypothetical protein
MSADSSQPRSSRQAQFRGRLIILVCLILLILLMARFLTAAQAPAAPPPGFLSITNTSSPTATFTPFPTSLFTPIVTFSAIPPTLSLETPTIEPTQTPVPPPGVTAPVKACQGFGKDEGKLWVVAGCDTLEHISQVTGINLPTLLAANPDIKEPDLIYPNQIILLPGR